MIHTEPVHDVQGVDAAGSAGAEAETAGAEGDLEFLFI